MENLRTLSFSALAFMGVSASANAQEEPSRISLVQLIATPAKYEGKIVALTGYVHLEFEGNGVYLHKDDYQYGLYKNGLWIDLHKCGSRAGEEFTDGYAYVIGRFTSARKGHMGLWSGELQDIKSCQSWPPVPPLRAGT